MQLNLLFLKVNDVVIVVNDRIFVFCKIVSHFVRDSDSLHFEGLLNSLCFMY